MMRIVKQWGIREEKKRFLEAGMLLEAALILVFGSAFFVMYDYVIYRCRATVNALVHRIDKKK